MGKYKIVMKCAEIRKLVDKKQFRNALAILETIDIDRVKSTADLNVFVDIYINIEKYEEARQVLLKIYEKSPTRRIIYQLLMVAIKTINVEEAERYYKQYKEIAPNDSELYIIRYLIDKEKKADKMTLIHTLEELKKVDYIEEWAYELAKLYHKAGMKKECIKECNDIVLWFGKGVIVEKARMLRDYYLGTATIPIGEIQRKLKKEETETINEKLAEEVVQAVHEKYTEKQEVSQIKKKEKKVKEENESASEELEFSSSLENFLGGRIEKREFENIFGNFIEIPIVKEQLENIFEKVIEQKEGNIFQIVGNAKCGKSTLAKMIAKVYYKMGLIGTPRVAKIEAEKLNRISLTQKKETIRNSCLLIENAKEMTISTLENLFIIIEELGTELIVILEEDKENSISFLEDYFVLEKRLVHIIRLPDYSKKDLYGFACYYMKDWGYYFSEDAKEGVEQIIDSIILQYQLEEQLEALIRIMEIVRKNMEIKNREKCFIIYLEDLITESIE